MLLKIEPQILELQNASLSLLFARKVSNSQVNAHQVIVMQYGSFADQKEFASYVPGADISLIGKSIVKKYKSTNPTYIYDFLNWIKVDQMEAIDYMVEVWDALDTDKRTKLFKKYVDEKNDTIFYQRMALKAKNAALEKVDEISNLIRTYQNQSKKA